MRSAKRKPDTISRWDLWKAYQKGKANRGAAGIDEASISDFAKDGKNNRSKIGNRRSSGSYFPPPVRPVTIPKKDGRERKLGIPTVSDRMAQRVVKRNLEPEREALFQEDSYGYRPKKSAPQALTQARQRCWKDDGVRDLASKGFFDPMDHRWRMKAVRQHPSEKWNLRYVERGLKAPIQTEDGKRQPREQGTPQGGVASPLLANRFLPYAFDHGMARHHPENPFARYADDAIVHGRSQREAEERKSQREKRFSEWGRPWHPVKTKIVSGKEDDRKGN